MSAISDVLAQLIFPPSVGSEPENVKEGVISLFKDAAWNSPRLDININDWNEKDRHLLKADFWDNATWVAWNLPIGTVATLADYAPPSGTPSNVGDLSNLGATVDLVGTGQVLTTDLGKFNMNDIVGSFFWRNVDLSQGVVEMFADLNWSGVCQRFFLSEWPTDTFINIDKWYINDKMTSASWKSLFDKQKGWFYADPNGGGYAYNNLNSWATERFVGDFRSWGFDDKVSCFRWSPLIPKLEIIQPVNFTAQRTESTTVGGTTKQENLSDDPIFFELNVDQTTLTTLSTSTTEKHVAKINAELTETAGVPEVDSTSFKLGLSYEYSEENTVNTTTSTELKVGIKETIEAAPHGTTYASLLVSVGTMPKAIYQTTATRWYDIAVTNSVLDKSHNNWYKRDETVSVEIGGGVCWNSAANVVFKPTPA